MVRSAVNKKYRELQPQRQETIKRRKTGDIMSVDFFGIGGPGQIGDPKKAQKSQQANKTEAGKKADQVHFSDVLQDVNKAKQGESAMSAERAARVEELKAQIADGSYKPDLNKVASSLLQFIVEEK